MKHEISHESVVEALEWIINVENEPAHVFQVTRLCDSLFWLLRKFHRCGEQEHKMLVVAALCHDLGWNLVPDGKGHHKASQKMIRSHSWTTLSPRTIEVVSQIARYHRGKIPDASHEEFVELSESDRQRILWMTSILRVADSLDRSHEQKLRQIRVEIDEKKKEIQLKIELNQLVNFEEELLGFQKKSNLIKKLLQPIGFKIELSKGLPIKTINSFEG